MPLQTRILQEQVTNCCANPQLLIKLCFRSELTMESLNVDWSTISSVSRPSDRFCLRRKNSVGAFPLVRATGSEAFCSGRLPPAAA
jgi:hypothetical protein